MKTKLMQLCGLLFFLSVFGIASQAISQTKIKKSQPIEATPFEFVAIGNMPYNSHNDDKNFTQLITAVNQSKADFVVHVGNIKDTRTLCSDETYKKIHDNFNLFAKPLIYTPGVHDWADCYVEASGAFNPLTRLDSLRKIFFKEPKSFGKSPIDLESQGRKPQYLQFVENLRWQRGQVMFVTLHMVSANNNLGSNHQHNEAAVKEYLDRNKANLDWLKESFEVATKQNLLGVVILTQADPQFELPFDKRTGYNDFLKLLEELTIKFERQILLVHGGTHGYRQDKPFLQKKFLGQADNLTRLETFGSPFIQAVRVAVDPKHPQLFDIKPEILIQNKLSFTQDGTMAK